MSKKIDYCKMYCHISKLKLDGYFSKTKISNTINKEFSYIIHNVMQKINILFQAKNLNLFR